MSDKNKSKKVLIDELNALRGELAEVKGQVAKLEQLGSRHKQIKCQLREIDQSNQAILNSLFAPIAVVDKTGVILNVNDAWQRFGRENNASAEIQRGIGLNYLEVCQSSADLGNLDAQQTLTGLKQLLDHSTTFFDYEYECHYLQKKRWYLLSAVPLNNEAGGLVISHINITPQKQAEEALRQRNRELQLLNEVSQVFISTLDLDVVLTTILEEVRNALQVVACSAWLVDTETNELVCRQVTDPQSKVVRGWRVPVGVGFVGQVAERGESLTISDTYTDERHFKGIDRQTGLDLRSILSVPLRVKDEVIGVLQAVDATVNRFTTADLALLEALAATVAIAIENMRLYEQARQDAETKSMLLNEVNHRVKNNLAAIIGLLYAERRHLVEQDRITYKTLMTDLINRIQGLGVVHSMLSASEWAPLQLSDLASQITHSAIQALPFSKYIAVEISPSSVRVTPKQANSLTLVINELATNTMKYALPDRDKGKIGIDIALTDDTICFDFRDDGPGYPEEILKLRGHNVGLYLIENIVRNDLHGTVTIYNDSGAVTALRFKLLK